MLSTLSQCEFSMGKTLLVYDMNLREMENYEKIYKDIGKQPIVFVFKFFFKSCILCFIFNYLLYSIVLDFVSCFGYPFRRKAELNI